MLAMPFNESYSINVTGLGAGFAWPCMASGSSEPLAASLGVALWQEFRCQMELVGLGFVRKDPQSWGTRNL